eukprot:1149519-Pelagomonas_calceolata.AAC.3
MDALSVTEQALGRVSHVGSLSGTSEQPCILNLCRGVAKVWGQKSGKMPAEVGSPGSCPLACTTSSDGWALYQEISLGHRVRHLGRRPLSQRSKLQKSAPNSALNVSCIDLSFFLPKLGGWTSAPAPSPPEYAPDEVPTITAGQASQRAPS